MTQNSDRPKPVNEMAEAPGQDGADTRTQGAEFLPVRRPGRPRLTPAQLAEARQRRAEQRKADLLTLPGLVREHARLLRRMHAQAFDLARVEILSRAFLRQRELVTAMEEIERLRSIQEQLERLQGRSPNGLRIEPVLRGENE